jgi:hypothetical protein
MAGVVGCRGEREVVGRSRRVVERSADEESQSQAYGL